MSDKDDYKKAGEEATFFIAARQEDEASEVIVKAILKNNHIYSTENDVKNEVWIYQDGVYIPNGKTKIQKIVRECIGKLYTAQRANYVIKKIEADTVINEKDFFDNNLVNEIPVENGILNIITKTLSPFDPKKIFFNKLPVFFDPSAKCPAIEEFYSQVLNSPEDAVVKFEQYGYDLYKDHFIEKAVMNVGDGRNGKGKDLALKKTFLGIENCASVSLNQMHSGSTSVCELHGKLVNIAGDLSNTALKDTGMFKQITGRDPIGAKRKYLSDLSFVNYSKQYFACNELPKVYDMSKGFWARWVLFKFPFEFVSKKEYDKAKDKTNLKIRDEQIIKKITTKNELSGLLNKALEGLERIIKNGDFSTTAGTKEVKDFWVRKSDPFMAFCLDNLDEEYDGLITKKEIRKEFLKYKNKHKLRGCGDKLIKINLEDNFGVTDTRNDNGENCWSGIKWKNPKNAKCKGSKGLSKNTVISNSKGFQKKVTCLTKEIKSEVSLKKNKNTPPSHGVSPKDNSRSIFKYPAGDIFTKEKIIDMYGGDFDKAESILNQGLERGYIIQTKPNKYQKNTGVKQ